MRPVFTCWALFVTMAFSTTVYGAKSADSSNVAQNENGLARIPTVSGRLFKKAGRVELALWAGAGVDDPFYYHAPLGLAVGYHVAESLSLNVRGAYWLSLARGPSIAPGAVPERDMARPLFETFGEVVWAPIYGKWSLLSRFFMHFDAHVKMGGGVTGTTAGSISPLVTVALGQRFRVTDWFVLSVEIRERVFRFQRLEVIDIDGGWQHLLSLGVGGSWMVGGDGIK